MRAFAGQNGDRMMRDHGLHPGSVLNRLLATYEIQRSGKDHDTRDDNSGVDTPFWVHAEHEQKHDAGHGGTHDERSEEHTAEIQSLMRIYYAVFCLKKKQLNHIKTIPNKNNNKN